MAIQLIRDDFNKAEALLRDALFKKNADLSQKENITILKLLRAREENPEFELGLAERICGDNSSYPYRSSYYITQFFQNLGLDFSHDGSTRRYWIRNVLEQMSSERIGFIVQKGLFRKRDYDNPKFRVPANKDFSNKEFFTRALRDFREFIDESSTSDEPLDLSTILNLNASIELLFKNKPQTKDDELNELIVDAKERFLNNTDQLTALEKLWDAFERIKTYFSENKKQSVKKLIDLMATCLEKDELESEFNALTSIGNRYRIRHHETDKILIDDPWEISYLFFRMLSIIDLALEKIKSSDETSSDLDKYSFPKCDSFEQYLGQPPIF